jgi:hypothetical protein
MENFLDHMKNDLAMVPLPKRKAKYAVISAS